MLKKDVPMEEKSIVDIFISLMKDVNNELESEVIKKLVKEMRPMLRQVETGKYAKDIKTILLLPGFRNLFWKMQIYRGGKEFNSRGIHTLRVCLRAMRLAKRAIKKGKYIDLSLVAANALAHDLGHFAFQHLAETEIDALIGYKWRHGQQGLWKYGFIEEEAISLLVLDGMLCHSEIEQILFFNPDKNLEVEEQLSSESRIPARIEVLFVKIADKFGNAIDDIDDASRNGVDISEVKSLLKALGANSEQIFASLTKGIEILEDRLILKKQEYEDFLTLQVFCFGETEKGIPGKIHGDPNLVRDREEIKSTISKILKGLAYFIKSKMYLKEDLDDLLVKRIVRSYMTEKREKYERAEEIGLININVEKILAKDIFADLTETEAYEVDANLAQYSHGYKGLQKARVA